jgi:FAD/FMN-containing dehydrogenase
MNLKQKSFTSEQELINHIKSGAASFYFSSRTSTVVPYDRLEGVFGDLEEIYLCDLSKLPSDYKLLDNGNLIIRGPLTWQDARIFLKSKGRNIMTSPTEDLALITAGAATSCTGERCFGYGNLRSQIVRIKSWDQEGIERQLSRDKKLPLDFVDGLDKYQKEFEAYKDFKNAPFPRLETETDLMIGTEGQLGVISEIEIETAPLFPVTYFFILLPKWEEHFEPHMEIFHKIQSFRNEVLSCELVDSNAFSYLDQEQRLGENNDVIFLEIKSDQFEKIYDELLSKLEKVSDEQMFEISEENFHSVRASIPRAVFEANSKAGVVKMGTDVQVGPDQFEELLSFYRKGREVGVKYNLFGHFGDAHLHFNFMPKPDSTDICSSYFEQLYDKVVEWKGSPFAEHGIGIIKQKYIKSFLSPLVTDVFKKLKSKLDPDTRFFPKGFMSVKFFE